MNPKTKHFLPYRSSDNTVCGIAVKDVSTTLELADVTCVCCNPALLQDEQTFDNAKYRSGYQIQTYDDGYGPLWISRNPIGINGIVRARTWEDAYSICEDEFFPEADETIEELKQEYDFRRESKKVVRDDSVLVATEHCGVGERFERPEDYSDNGRLPEHMFVRWETIQTPEPDSWSENELFQESFGFRPNGANSRDKLGHGIYSKDLNGDYLERLTAEMCADIGIVLEIPPLHYYEVICGNIGTVYSGTDFDKADDTYREYVNQSMAGYGRAAEESVSLMENGEPIKEHFGPADDRG